jgi:hypothetical protein
VPILARYPELKLKYERASVGGKVAPMVFGRNNVQTIKNDIRRYSLGTVI